MLHWPCVYIPLSSGRQFHKNYFTKPRAKASGSNDFFAGLPLPLAFGKASQREAPAPHKRNDHRDFQAFQNTVYTYFKVFQSSKKVVKNLLPAIVGACLPQNHHTPSITYFSLKDSKKTNSMHLLNHISLSVYYTVSIYIYIDMVYIYICILYIYTWYTWYIEKMLPKFFRNSSPQMAMTLFRRLCKVPMSPMSAHGLHHQQDVEWVLRPW